LTELLAGKAITTPLTKPHGCSTKWREKRQKNAAVQATLDKTPVLLEKIDASDIAALRANTTQKYRLINVWATWCAPCVSEFPAIVALSRKFDRREFDVITISLDEAKQEGAARVFLEKNGAGLSKRRQASIEKEGRKTNHYLYAGGSQDALVAALDAEWPGPLPHTVLIAPGGKIVWRQNGQIDAATAIAQIVKAMGPYYVPPP
jgi:thiol-disulfide isomerase/thioredoxin